MRVSAFLAAGALGACALAVPLACDVKEPEPSSYFDTAISPVLTASCVRANTGAGCHVMDSRGYALGNLDVSTYAAFSKRKDLQIDYGPYGQPALLLKNVPHVQLTIQTFDSCLPEDGGAPCAVVPPTITTDIKHAGGPILDPTASGYQVIRRYLDNGATENNSGAQPAALVRTPCVDIVPGAAGFDPTTDPAAPDYQTFKARVNPIINTTCSAGNCHGTQVNDLFFACGATDPEIRWNYYAATQYLGQTPQTSEIVRRPLAPDQGGAFHEGGVIFQTQQDPGYQSILAWATQHGPLDFGTLDPAFAFFVHDVQPILVKKGCMMVQCHSPAMFHDYRLSGGAGGNFSFSASNRNYALTVQQMSFESDDVTASRLVRKNLYRPEVFTGSNGLTHRGGPLFEDFTQADGGATILPTNATCDAQTYPYDDPTQLDTIPAFCVIREWLRRERVERNLAPLSAVVYVSRTIPAAPDRPQDFDVFAGGATLHIAQATQDPATNAVTLGADNAVDLSGCGITGSVDIKRPAVSWDGQTIAFAARTSATTPLQVYTMKADGTGCALEPTINAAIANVPAGVLVHNFDPQFSPPGPDGAERIVFASTRGNDPSFTNTDYHGPQNTPSDPSKPNANLYILEPNGSGGNQVRQLTYQLNMERYPSFMQDGRLIFAVEKRAPGFYQLALRRQNLDGGDYHPLYAQRGSIGYHEATQVVELSDKNFAAIFSEPGDVHGGGVLAVFNRSIGVDFTSQNPSDYVQDPTVTNPSSPTSVESDFFLHSLSYPDTSVSAEPGTNTPGVYTSPSPIPGAQLLVSYGAASGDATTFGGDYDVYVMDPSTGAKTKLLGAAGTAEVDAVGVYAKASKGIFVSSPSEPNGVTKIVTPNQGEADITMLDFPVLASLLFQNTPTGRTVDTGLSSFDIYEDLPPTPDVTSYQTGGANVVMDMLGPSGQVYVRRRLIGTVPLASDGSAHFKVPGGVPIVLHLPDTALSKANPTAFPRYQREAITYYPGEYAHQAFQTQFFNGLCGQCHGAQSGRPTDISVQPDMLTQASSVISLGAPPVQLDVAPGMRGAVTGPPPSP